jgi:predicted ATPase/DNA-binding CsgD family transcriptional regulator
MTSASSRGQAGNLPIESKRFVGRRDQLRQARRLLADARVLTLVGPGGVGKTRLALRLAAGLGEMFPDGVWLVELAPLQDPSLVPQTVIAALGLSDRSARPPANTLSEYLADKRLLLVLDNCEHLPDACAALAANLLAECEAVWILATSRQPLDLEGERLLEVPPLSAPEPDQPAASSLVGSEAVSLFIDRAATVVPGFAITADNGAAIARLCRRLDGIPLAIELAAMRLRVLSAQQILERLDDRYRLLTSGTRTLARHQTLKAAIDWSYDLCSAQEQILWARLSVFSGGFDLEAAEHTCSDGNIAPGEIRDLVAGLVDKSIAAREERDAQTRFRLLETLRQYGRDRLVESGQAAHVQRRHCDYYHDLALRAEADYIGPRQAESLRRLRLELPNLRVMLNHCLTEPGRVSTGLRTAGALLPYWIFYGVLGEPRRWLTQALEADKEPTVIRAKALAVAALLGLLQGDIDAALRLRDDGAALARRLDDGRVHAHTTHISGITAWAQGDLDTAIPLLAEALERSRTDGDDAYEVFINMLFLTIATALRGDEGSGACAEELMTAVQNIDADFMMAWATWALGMHHWRHGDNRRATELFKEALRLHCAYYNSWGYAWCTEALAWAAADDGQNQRAAGLLGATQASLRSLGGMGGFQMFAAAHERCEAQLRRALGDDAYAEAVHHGAELDTDETTAYALSEELAVPSRAAPPPGADNALTRRERQVAELIARGMSNKQIAAELVVSPRTAEGHVERILTKLGLSSRTQVVTWAATSEKDPPGATRAAAE